MRRRFLLIGLALLSACTAVPQTPPTQRAVTVRGELPKAGGAWQTQAVTLTNVVLVQAEIGGPGLSAPLVAQAALDPDFHFAVPFAAVPLGDNRPVTITGYGVDGRPVPGVVLQGWLSVSADGFWGQATASSTPVGAVLKRLWDRATTDALAAIIAAHLNADDLQTWSSTLNQSSGQDYSLFDSQPIVEAILAANRNRSQLDVAANGVRLPTSDSSMIAHPAGVRGTIYGLIDGEGLQALAFDDPLSPTLKPLPTVSGTPYLFYPIVPGSRRLTAVYGPTGANPVRISYGQDIIANADASLILDTRLPTVSPRQLPAGGTVRITGGGFGTDTGSISAGSATAPAWTVAKWSDSEIRLTLPANQTAESIPLFVDGRGWHLGVQALQVLAGPPQISTVAVTAGANGQILRVTGSNFSAFASDHQLSVVGSDNIAIPLPVTKDGDILNGAVPAGVSGSMLVKLSIGDVPATTTPSVTL